MTTRLFSGSLRRNLAGCCSVATLRSHLPVLTWLPVYSLTWLKMDVLAGLTVGLTTIPQALAYAEVAGLPVQGFTCAAAVTIGFGQVKNILGVKDVPQQFFLQVYYTFQKLPEARVGDVALGLSCLFFLVMMTMMKSSLGSVGDNPSPVVTVSRGLVWTLATVRNALVVIAATCVAYSAEVTGHNFFTLTGKTVAGLPPFSAPPLSEMTANGTHISFSQIIQDLGGGLAVIPLMGVLESIAIAKAFGSKNNYRINANQELFAIGLNNILGSFVSAYPVTGSFGRTAVNSQTGVCTPAGGIVTGVLVLLSLAFLMPLFSFIPKASLAAVIICAVGPMFEFSIPPHIWRVRRLDLLPFSVTFLLCFWEVQYGIVGGVAISGFMLLYLMARPEVKVTDHGVLVIELGSGLHFPAIEHFCDVLRAHALHVSPPRRCVLLDCQHVSSIDYTVVNELRDLLKQFNLHSVSLVFSGLKRSVLEVLLAADLPGFRHTDSVEAGLQILITPTMIDAPLFSSSNKQRDQ